MTTTSPAARVSGTIKADAVRLADQAETLAAPLVGQHEALQKHHLETAAALRTLAAIQPDPQPESTDVVFGRQHFEPKRDSDRKPWDATTEPQSDHIAASGNMVAPQPVEWDAHAEFKAAEDHARKALRYVCGDLSGQHMSVRKHEARNHEHLRRIYAEARDIAPRFADTLAWLLWHDILDAQRLAMLSENATPASAGTVSVEAAARVLLDNIQETWRAFGNAGIIKAERIDAALRALAGEGGR